MEFKRRVYFIKSFGDNPTQKNVKSYYLKVINPNWKYWNLLISVNRYKKDNLIRSLNIIDGGRFRPLETSFTVTELANNLMIILKRYKYEN